MLHNKRWDDKGITSLAFRLSIYASSGSQNRVGRVFELIANLTDEDWALTEKENLVPGNWSGRVDWHTIKIRQ